MRISHKHKFIFLSKHKGATTSIRKILDPYSDIVSSDEFPYFHHTTAFELKLHFEQMNWCWDEYFKFISIRNPWDLVVSMHTYGKPDINGNYWYMKGYEENSSMSFAEWVKGGVKTWHKIFIEKDGSLKRNFFASDFSRQTLNNYIFDKNGNQLVDLIIKVENLEQDLRFVFGKLGLPIKNILKLNTTSHGNYRKFYDEESKLIVAEQFWYDIQIGNYEF